MPYKLHVKPEFSSFVTVTPELEARVNELAINQHSCAILQALPPVADSAEGYRYWEAIHKLFTLEWIEPFNWREATLGEIADKVPVGAEAKIQIFDIHGPTIRITDGRQGGSYEIESFLKGGE